MLAVLEKRGGLHLGTFDGYINVVGGLSLDEPAADLPVALAVASSYRDKPLPQDLAAIGEIGLAGEVRAVSHLSPAPFRNRTSGFYTLCHSQERNRNMSHFPAWSSSGCVMCGRPLSLRYNLNWMPFRRGTIWFRAFSKKGLDSHTM